LSVTLCIILDHIFSVIVSLYSEFDLFLSTI
jgi:hypothetical protein